MGRSGKGQSPFGRLHKMNDVRLAGRKRTEWTCGRKSSQLNLVTKTDEDALSPLAWWPVRVGGRSVGRWAIVVCGGEWSKRRGWPPDCSALSPRSPTLTLTTLSSQCRCRASYCRRTQQRLQAMRSQWRPVAAVCTVTGLIRLDDGPTDWPSSVILRAPSLSASRH